MKEEVGMKRRGPTWALVVLVAAGVALTGSTALAQEDIYENYLGLQGATNVGPVSDFQGMQLNPNGIGQYLVGTYYDVRDYEGEAQHNNIQIINTNTNNTLLPDCSNTGTGGVGGDSANDKTKKGIDGAACYNEAGGIYAKVRFRESKGSVETFDFVIALSCGEVWAARLSQAADGYPQIASEYPVAGNPEGAAPAVIVTKPYFNSASPDYLGDTLTKFFRGGVTKPAGVSVEDLQRGYFEVVAMEALNCEPDSGELDMDGGEWTTLDGRPMASNGIGGEVFLVRAGSGVSHNYNMTAVSNFAASWEGDSRAKGIEPTKSTQPTWRDCDQDSGTIADAADCVQQANLVLSKSRVIAQYDVDPITAGSTAVVVTMPTKYENCVYDATTGAWTGQAYAGTSFECDAAGEETVCTIYDRQENLIEEFEVPISPAPPGAEPCRLPREVSVIGLALTGENERADFTIATGGLPFGESGWFDLDVTHNVANAVIHREVFPDGTTQNITGGYLWGYRGLPIVGLVMQEFQNGVVGGVYGNTVAPLYEQVILKEGQS